MQSSDTVGFLGKPVEDLYGRRIGVAVGYSLKTNGDVDSIGVDQGSGSFIEVKSNRLVIHEQALIVVPLWKADVMRLTGETDILTKRLSALLELLKDSSDGSRSLAQYSQLRGEYEARLAKVQQSSERLFSEIKTRMEEIETSEKALADFLVDVNIQFRSGEISEASFGVMSVQCETMRARNAKEMEELAASLDALVRKQQPPQPAVELRVPVSA